MLWRYWARERGREPPAYSPIVRDREGAAVLTTVIARRLPAAAEVVGEFIRQEAGAAPVLPLRKGEEASAGQVGPAHPLTREPPAPARGGGQR
jgi:hypothetical protein